MHRMTRDASSAEIRRRSTGCVLDFKGDSASARAARWAALPEHHAQRGGRPSSICVTKVIGGRYREDFAGIEVAGHGPAAARFGDERMLPVSYLIFDEKLAVQGLLGDVAGAPGLRQGARWRTTCIFCHNTRACFLVAARRDVRRWRADLSGLRQLRAARGKTFRFVFADRDELERAVRVELKSLGSEEAPPSGKRSRCSKP